MRLSLPDEQVRRFTCQNGQLAPRHRDRWAKTAEEKFFGENRV
jgi:hypothetical protein